MELKDIENLAELARIEISDEEKNEVLNNMYSIVKYVQTIEGVDVDDVEENHEVYNVWREDEERGEEDFNKDSILEQFPEKNGRFLKVKKIL